VFPAESVAVAVMNRPGDCRVTGTLNEAMPEASVVTVVVRSRVWPSKLPAPFGPGTEKNWTVYGELAAAVSVPAMSGLPPTRGTEVSRGAGCFLLPEPPFRLMPSRVLEKIELDSTVTGELVMLTPSLEKASFEPLNAITLPAPAA